MPVAIVLLAVGGLMAYSAIRGVSIADAWKGLGRGINPAGPEPPEYTGPDTPGAAGDTKGDSPGGAKGEFKGPNAALLEALRKTAVERFNLTVSQICRPQDANYGAPNSLHKQCRAMDLTGTVANRIAFARYAKGVSGVQEVFCDQAGMVAPGYDHSDHVHVDA